MARPFTRSAEVELRTRLGLEQLKRDREERRLQSMERLGGQVVGGLQQGLQQGIGAVDSHLQRKAQAEALEKKLGLEQQRIGIDQQQMLAAAKAARDKAEAAALQQRLAALPDVAPTNLKQAENLAGARVTKAALAGRESKADVTVADFRSALENDGFSTENIDDARLRAAMGKARLELEKGTLEEDAELKKYKDALRGVRLAENERDRLAGTTLALAKMSDIKEGAQQLPKKDRELMREVMDLFIMMEVEMIPSASLSANVAMGFATIAGGANATVAASGSTGQHNISAESIAKLEARWTELESSKSFDWLKKVDTFNRAYAKAAEPRLTDKDWQWYEKNLLTPWRGEDVFAERFNSLAEELHGKLSLDVSTIANVGPDGSPRADVPELFKKAVEDYDPAKIGFSAEDRKTYKGGQKFVDAKKINPIRMGYDKAQGAMERGLPVFIETASTELDKRTEQVAMDAAHNVDTAVDFVIDKTKEGGGAAADWIHRKLRALGGDYTGLSQQEMQALEKKRSFLAAQARARRRVESEAPRIRALIKSELGVDVPPDATMEEMDAFLSAKMRLQSQGE